MTLINLLTGEVLTRDAVAEIYAANPNFVRDTITALGRYERVPGLVSAAFAHYGKYCERCGSTSAVRAVESGEMLCIDCRSGDGSDDAGDFLYDWHKETERGR